jgi:hypothetical protein
MDDLPEIFPIHYDATLPPSKEKGQSAANFVVATLGNSSKIRHDAAS